ncbi:leucine-rich repeat-containing protein 18-like [Pseudophryne corroboree]|uniref:leucine-rich repeat-containing protein 18-like n=1 Tax=Pseudophryne corroboree TaxID=495146 RepID=UPI0030812F7F
MASKRDGLKGKTVTLQMAKNAIKESSGGKKRLVLSNLGIKEFPKCLKKLTSEVEELDISRNYIKKLPDWIQSFKSLCWLDVHTNHIEALPSAIGQLKQLSYLNLSNNNITEKGIPAEISQLKNIRKLNLGLNKISVLPPSLEALTQMTELGLFDNYLKEIPPGMLKMPKVKINLKGNPIPPAEQKEAEVETSTRNKELYLVPREDLCSACLSKSEKNKTKIKNLIGMCIPNSIRRRFN